MKPVAVMPMNDSSGVQFQHIKALTPLLKTLFAGIFLSVSRSTRQAQPEPVAWLHADDFYRVVCPEADPPVGDEFAALYRYAADACQPDQIVHLCYGDRLAFALQTDYRAQFIADIQALRPEHMPLIFHRSPAAWETHPRNYRDIEQAVNRVGEWLFHKMLDYSWCHLALRADQLKAVLPRVKNHDLSMVAEIVLWLRDEAQTKEVDWLAWEDPFILSRDPQQLRAEREQSAQEIRKRLAYTIPMLQLLYGAADGAKCRPADRPLLYR